jgi:Fe-S cluster assembly protein SufD
VTVGLSSSNLFTGKSVNAEGFWLDARRADGAEFELKSEPVKDGRRLTVPEGCQATLIEKSESMRPEPYTTQSKWEIVLSTGAKLSHYKLVHEGQQATHHSYTEVDVQKAASFQSHVFLFEGAQIRNTIHVRMSGEDADCLLEGLYVGSGTRVIENHTLIDHQKPRGTSRELYKGILDGRSRGLFDGLIVVQKAAQKTDSAQTNKNLLLSTEAKAVSNPELKIFANDVKCKHGSTIGQIDAAQLFYMRSRGVPLAEARRLLVYAFASEMINQVEVPALRDILFPCLNLATSIRK